MMGVTKKILLWSSTNEWMNSRLPRYGFVQRAVRRFMPGEEIDDALGAVDHLHRDGIAAILTHLGENLNDLSEAEEVTDHYFDVIAKLGGKRGPCQLSVKLTQLGLDLSPEKALHNFRRLASKAAEKNIFIWIDMESSDYTDAVIEFYKNIVHEFPHTGLCLQAYLFRSAEDMEGLFPLSSSIRLVKGAYKEPGEVAFRQKRQVDINYFNLAMKMLQAVKERDLYIVFATHDTALIRRIADEAEKMEVARYNFEIHMLYGIRTEQQKRLAAEGFKVGTLISYGHAWFAWYMRRLAERPANIWFVVKNMFRR